MEETKGKMELMLYGEAYSDLFRACQCVRSAYRMMRGLGETELADCLEEHSDDMDDLMIRFQNRMADIRRDD